MLSLFLSFSVPFRRLVPLTSYVLPPLSVLLPIMLSSASAAAVCCCLLLLLLFVCSFRPAVTAVALLLLFCCRSLCLLLLRLFCSATAFLFLFFSPRFCLVRIAGGLPHFPGSFHSRFARLPLLSALTSAYNTFHPYETGMYRCIHAIYDSTNSTRLDSRLTYVS